MLPRICCRTCMSAQCLNPIFLFPEHNEKYTNVLFNATGIEIEPNDSLPQHMCSNCIHFINESTKFRKRCEEAQEFLLAKGNRINCKEEWEEAPLSIFLSDDVKATIDLSMVKNSDYEVLIDVKDDGGFNDYDDNITLDSLQQHNNVDNTNRMDIETVHVGEPEIAINKKRKRKKAKELTDCVNNIGLDTLNYNNITEKTKGTDVIIDGTESGVTVNGRRKRKTKDTVVLEKPKRKVRCKKENNENAAERKENSDKKGKAVKQKAERVREEIECEVCHKILTSKLSLRNHYKIHSGFDVVCEHCGRKFITRRLLLMHCRAKHGYEKVDKCSFCDYKASNAEQVKIHERLHTGEKPYVCAECNAGFHRQSSYLQHIAIHLPEKTVLCDECPARFKSVTLMRIHKRRHRTPQYTFRCGVCGGTFARRRNVARHLERVHHLPPTDIVRDKIH